MVCTFFVYASCIFTIEYIVVVRPLSGAPARITSPWPSSTSALIVES